jgi:hypothetical protein
MADFNKIAQQVTEVAERVADVSDAARGKRAGKGGGARWLILPAVGAAVYAVAKNGSAFGRSTKAVVGQARDLASEVPDMDLLGRVKEVAGVGDNGHQDDDPKPARQRRSDAGQLQQNRRERAEHRQRRRASTST